MKSDAAVVVGVLAIVAGCVLVAIPLGLIVGGLALMGLGFVLGGE